MRGFILRWGLNAIALYVTASLITGIQIRDAYAVLVAALIWGLVNTVIRPVLNVVALPINLITVGLFTFVVNGLQLWLVARLVDGFIVDTVWIGILGALILSVVSSLLSALVTGK
jgi:putative membrane protein